MNFFQTLIILLQISLISSEEEDEDEKMRKNIIAFNDEYISLVKDGYSRVLAEDRGDEIAVKIGVLANYFRVFKRLVPWSYQEKGFEQLYPEPEYDFDSEISIACQGGLEVCIDFILQQINSTQSWIGQNTFNMDELSLKTVINNQRIGFEISASQILCFLTMSRIMAFENIPYCSYRVQPTVAESMKWTGESFLKDTLIDEFVGKSFECATESFCPDPCCSKIPEIVRSSQKYAPFCRMNLCQKTSTCELKNFENDDLFNMRLNKWNISCGCEKPSLIYRPDIGKCVPHNPCNKQQLCRDLHQECVNVASGYKCVCQLGYFMNESKVCVPLTLPTAKEISEPIEYQGFAFSEPYDRKNDSNYFSSQSSFKLLAFVIVTFIAKI